MPLRSLLVVVVLVASSSASAQLIDRGCTRELDEAVAELARTEEERASLLRRLGLQARDDAPAEGDCETRLAVTQERLGWARADVEKLRERIEQEKAQRVEAKAMRGETPAMLADLDALRAELRGKQPRKRGPARVVVQGAATDVDIPTLQLGVVLTSIGGGAVVSAVLGGIMGAGLLVLGSSPGLEPFQTTAALVLVGALLEAALGAGLLFFGANRLEAGLGGARE